MNTQEFSRMIDRGNELCRQGEQMVRYPIQLEMRGPLLANIKSVMEVEAMTVGREFKSLAMMVRGQAIKTIGLIGSKLT